MTSWQARWVRAVQACCQAVDDVMAGKVGACYMRACYLRTAQCGAHCRKISGGVCVATAEIISLTKRSGVARIDITNDGAAVCAAQGTVTIVAPRG